MKRNLEKEINYKENLREFSKVAWPYKWTFIFIIFLVLLYEVVNIVEKYLFKIILDTGAQFVSAEILKNKFLEILLVIAAVYVGMSIFKIVNHWLRIGSLNKVETSMIFDFKRKFFNHIVHLDHNFHTTHKTGALISRLNRGGHAIEKLADFIVFNVAPLVLQLFVLGATLFFFDVLSALSIISTSIIFIAFGLYLSKIQKGAQVQANDAEDYEKAAIADVFTNIDSIKYFGKESVIKDKFENISDDTRKKRIKLWSYHRVFGSGEGFILSIGTFFVIYFPLLRFLEGEITIGTLAFIYTAFGGIVGPLFGFVHGMRGFFISLGDLQEIYEYDKITNEIVDKPNAKKLKINKGEITFRDVWFKYKKGKNAINGLSLEIKPNEKIAFVGHSGCGKTTLVKLLYRFFDVDAGAIIIDGKNIKEFKQESLRGELSIVPQEAILFDDTIFNNIAFSNPVVSREEVLQAIKFAQLDRLIDELPNKEKTIVGERGIKLSGGERQRVSIARAILANKKVLVLDEATSSLDSETEYEIQRDLEKLMQGRTSIIIAHRLSTIMKADKIVVMDKGKIVQIGKHTELINQIGQYKKLWNLQKGGYIKD